MNWIIKLLLSAVSVFLVSYILGGVHVDGFLTAIIIALVISLLNFFLRPLLVILTIPVTIVTLGLFLLVINAIIVLLADEFISGFAVDGLWWAMLFSILVSLVNYFLGVKQSEN